MVNRNGIVTKPSSCACGCVHVTRLHHQEFPEGWVEGESPEEAAKHLINQLTRALDNTGSERRRHAIGMAIADAEEFFQVSHERAKEGGGWRAPQSTQGPPGPDGWLPTAP